MRPASWMRPRDAAALLSAAGVVVVVTSGWTINEVGKNNRAILNLSERTRETADAIAALTRKVDRLRPLTVGHEHSDVRQFMIRAHLTHVVSPVVVFGDSITEAADLPEAICGHPVVNAGIGGAGVDELLKDAPLLLEGKSPALVVLAIGTNDAYATPGREQQFRESYTALLHRLAILAPKLVIANIPPVDPKGPLTAATGIDASLIERYNLILPKLAEDAGVSFVDLNRAVSADGTAETIDGVHLAPRAYNLWDAAMLAGLKNALNCSASYGAPILGQRIEELSTRQEQMAGENAKAIEQLTASQDQLARDNAKTAEQIKAVREQTARFPAARASEDNLQPKTPAPKPHPIAAPKP